MSDDKSILKRLDERGAAAPRVALQGSTRAEKAAQRYEFRGEIGRGAMGRVHHGHDNDIGRDVALKVLLDEHLGNPSAVQRFVEEAQIAGQLQHPGIVPVYELMLRAGGRPCFAMKLVKGETLASRLAAREDLAADRRLFLSVFRDVCRAVSYAHARRVIHRDLKPSNVMIGSFGEVQVVDWGLAKVLQRGGVADEVLGELRRRQQSLIETVRSSTGADASLAGSVLGTPAYMSPEQALGRIDDVDERSDLFSLGAILCEILTGDPPYVGSDDERLQAARQSHLAPALARLDTSNADAQLIALCRNCLAALPKDRPASAAAIADEVAAYLKGIAQRAHEAELRALRAAAASEEQRRGRQQTIFVAGALLVIAMVVVGSFLVIDAGRADRERARRGAVEAALQDASRLRAAQQWPGALAAAERAIQLGDDGKLAAEIEGEARTATELAQRQADEDAFLAELDEIREQWNLSLMAPPQPQGGAVGLFGDEITRAYAASFKRRYGTLENAIEPLRASRHAARFAANITFWMFLLDARSLDPRQAVMVGLLPRGTQKQRQPGSVRDRLDHLARALDPQNADVLDALDTGNLYALLTIARDRCDTLPTWLVVYVGDSLRHARRMQDAETMFIRRLRRTPDDFQLNLLAGTLSRQPGHAVARRHLEAAVALRPDSFIARESLANAAQADGDAAGTIANLRRLIEKNPADALAQRQLGWTLKVAGDYPGAIAAYRRAFELEPNEPSAGTNLGFCLMSVGDKDGAIAVCRKLIELGPDQPIPHLILGDALAQKGDHRGAIAAFRVAEAALSGFFYLHGALADSLASIGDLDGCIESCRKAIALSPRNGGVHAILGSALLQKGDVEGSLAECWLAVEYAPLNQIAFLNLGNALATKRDFAGSMVAARRALELKPEMANAHVLLGRSLCATGDHQGGLAEIRRGIELKPDQAYSWGVLAQALVGVGDLDGALAAWRKVVELDPHRTVSWQNIAVELARRGDSDGAIAACRQAVQANPDNAQAQTVLGGTLSNVGQLDEAVQVLRHAVELDPSSVMAHHFLGITLQKHDDPEGALDAFRKASALDPDDTVLSGAVKRLEEQIAVHHLLPRMLEQGEVVVTPRERSALAALLAGTKHFELAARNYAQAFAEAPELTERAEGRLYAAACAAAQAGPSWRLQAIAWLRTNLVQLGEQVVAEPEKVAKVLDAWKSDTELAGLRGTDDTRELWTDVEAMHGRAQTPR